MLTKRQNMRTKIEVTEELIAQSTRASSSHCMIADAIKAALPGASHVMVDLQTIRFTDREKGERRIYFTPPLCQQQLLRFDQGTAIEPWSFRLPTTPAQVVPKNKGEAAKTELVMPKEGRRTPPVVRGGRSLPTSVLSSHKGSRRVFGVRAAKGFDPSQPAATTSADPAAQSC